MGLTVSEDAAGPPACYWMLSFYSLTVFMCVCPQEVKAELEQEAAQLKSFCSLGSELSVADAFGNAQSLLDNVRGVSDEFTQLEASVSQR